jgi:hypothetical protein
MARPLLIHIKAFRRNRYPQDRRSGLLWDARFERIVQQFVPDEAENQLA